MVTDFGSGGWLMCKHSDTLLQDQPGRSLLQPLRMYGLVRVQLGLLPGHAGVGAVADVGLQSPLSHLHQCCVRSQLETHSEIVDSA